MCSATPPRISRRTANMAAIKIRLNSLGGFRPSRYFSGLVTMHLSSKTLPLAIVAALLPACFIGLRAQESTGTVFRSDTHLVVLHASVVDKGGHLITALQKDAFKV